MKKEGVVAVFLLTILLISPLVYAQGEAQTYSGFNRFVDNVKLFFSFGDNKVRLALEIREKEVNSAIENDINGNKETSGKNLEKAWKKLQMIQERISLNTAEEIKESSSEIIDTIKQEENLSEDFEVYSLEEEKTGLTAEWVIEVNGKEGQSLTNQISVNRTNEIENRIDEIDGKISNWVVEHTYAEGTSAGGEAGVVVEGGLINVVKTEVANGDDGLKPEVKTYVAGDGTQDNDVATDGDGGGSGEGYAPGTVAGGDSPGDTIDDTYDDDSLTSVDAGITAEGDKGTEGTNDVAPAVESNEGD